MDKDPFNQIDQELESMMGNSDPALEEAADSGLDDGDPETQSERLERLYQEGELTDMEFRLLQTELIGDSLKSEEPSSTTSGQGDKLQKGHEKSRESLPKGVYRPDSDEYPYAVKWSDVDGKTQREYYETRTNAESKAERVKNGPNKMMLLRTK